MASAEQRKSNGENKVKLADIAKQTGYSLATVSKALNGKADISEVARQAIDKALKDNGYIRRVSLSRKQRTIEVVFRDFETIWALEVLRGIITEAKPHNINVMVAESGDRQHPDSSWLKASSTVQPIGAHSGVLQLDGQGTQHVPITRHSFRRLRPFRQSGIR